MKRLRRILKKVLRWLTHWAYVKLRSLHIMRADDKVPPEGGGEIK